MDVIIPTRNSESVLENCLRTLRTQTKPVNIIVVDARSTDRTVEIAKEYGCTVVEEPKSNARGSRRAVACNEGLRHTTSKFVGFLDSDTEVPPQWAVDMEATMLEYSEGAVECDINDPIPVAAITSGCEPDVSSGLSTAINNVMRIASNHARKYSEVTYIQSVPGYNAVYLKSAIYRVGGFSEEIGGCEDWELNSRLRKAGYALLGIPQSPVVHRERATYRAFIKQMQGYGWSWGRLLRVKHIFKLSRAVPLLALVFGAVLASYFLVFYPVISAMVIVLAMLAPTCMWQLKHGEEVSVFVVMQLFLAIGYFKGLFL